MAAPLPLPALHATHAGIWIAEPDGEPREATRGEAIARAAETPHVLLNAPLVGQRLGYPEISGLDLLELFAFIHPAHVAMAEIKQGRYRSIAWTGGYTEYAVSLLAKSDRAFKDLADIKGRTLVTPGLELGILAGETRAALLEIAPSLGYEVEDGAFPLEELARAEEAFTSSSVREVMPVVELDGRALGRGPAAGELQEALRRLAAPVHDEVGR